VTEITLPTIPWKKVFKPRTVLALLLFAGLLYWLIGVRPYLQISGAHLSAPTLQIRTDQMGRLLMAPHEEGAAVKQGEVLFSLSSQEERAQQAQWQAEIDSLQEKLASHLMGAEKAMQNYLTLRSEAEMGLIPSDRFEQPLAVLQEQQAQVNDCKQRISLAKSKLEMAQALVKQKTMSAPFSGVIVKREKREGDVVQFGDLIYSFCDPSKLWIDAVVPETEIAKVALGQKATIRFLSDSHRHWDGKVSWISSVARSSGEGVPIRIALEKTEDVLLRPNLTADVKIKIY
jgi:membrane fusion protein, multidrug efflux system